MGAAREHVANIEERGIRRRRMGGHVWQIVSVVALAVMLVLCVPRTVRLALFVPVFMAALGYQQARERT